MVYFLNGNPPFVRQKFPMDITGLTSRTVLTYRHHHVAESDGVKEHIRINKEIQGMA